jgi:DNA-binding NtrC family response regulator
MSAGTDAAVVLLVEEETHELETIRIYLEQEGFAVLASANSDDAMEHVETRPDIRAVITDAHVPGAIDGVDFARTICERWPGLALVMTSGHSDGKSGDVPPGAVFINKPNLLEYLGPTLRRLMDKRSG